jgi:hypothetical protein
MLNRATARWAVASLWARSAPRPPLRGQRFRAGGLLISQLLTLYTTPVIYLYMERLAQRWRKRKSAAEPAAITSS